ncbi:hypothetical protein GUJ93_ZPchr0298g29134 [Zizania palustris]|uniref:Uncharacterized protein n=1 Tax=Zizania palustris TaxID=103762 RepID=A0A8J5X6F0_ZIZPA|nr:hypothetical protein GUJ93_ZPchr0298g29134 [Zizania palustris]
MASWLWQKDAQTCKLVLIGVNPTVQSLRMLGEHCRSLERLALCGCETVGDAEIICLAERCVALKKLCIKGCPSQILGWGH